MAIAVTLHMLFVTVWVGGMFFAHMCLRPVAVAQLEPPLRLRLWAGVFSRFFPWVWGAVATILLSGLWIIFGVWTYGGLTSMAVYVQAMLLIGLVMAVIFSVIYFSPYQALKAAVTAENWPQGGAQLARIRRLVGINLILGLTTVAIGSGGRYLGY